MQTLYVGGDYGKTWWGCGETRGGRAALLCALPGRHHCRQLQPSPQGALEASLELVLSYPVRGLGKEVEVLSTNGISHWLRASGVSFLSRIGLVCRADSGGLRKS